MLLMRGVTVLLTPVAVHMMPTLPLLLRLLLTMQVLLMMLQSLLLLLLVLQLLLQVLLLLLLFRLLLLLLLLVMLLKMPLLRLLLKLPAPPGAPLPAFLKTQTLTCRYCQGTRPQHCNTIEPPAIVLRSWLVFYDFMYIKQARIRAA